MQFNFVVVSAFALLTAVAYSSPAAEPGMMDLKGMLSKKKGKDSKKKEDDCN